MVEIIVCFVLILDSIKHSNRGLLDSIPAERFCDDIEKISYLKNNARCICEQKSYRVNYRKKLMAVKTTEAFLNGQISRNASKICMKVHLQLNKINMFRILPNITDNNSEKRYKVHAVFELKSFTRHGVSFSVVLHYQHNLVKPSFKVLSFNRNDYFHARFEKCFSQVPWVPPEVCIC